MWQELGLIGVNQDVGENFSIIFQKYMVLYIWLAYCLDVVSKDVYAGSISLTVAMLRRGKAFNVCGLSKAYHDTICHVVISQTEPSPETKQR